MAKFSSKPKFYFRKSLVLGGVAMALLITAFVAPVVLAQKSKSESVVFTADKVLLQKRVEIKTELETKILEARKEKALEIARQEEAKREAEEAAKLAAEKEAARIASATAKISETSSRPVAVNRSESSSRGDGIYKTGTAYTSDPAENGGWNVTATGENLDALLARGERVVASNDFALGTILVINGQEWRVADRMAHSGKVDFLVGSKEEARQFGRQTVHIQAIK